MSAASGSRAPRILSAVSLLCAALALLVFALWPAAPLPAPRNEPKRDDAPPAEVSRANTVRGPAVSAKADEAGPRTDVGVTVLKGRVVTSLGAPIVGAKIEIARFDELSASLLTDAEGRFETVVEPGPLDIEASAPGFVPQSRGFDGPDLEPSAPEITLRLARASTLAGKVVRADTGEAVGGCDVQVTVEEDESLRLPSATTETDGTFRIDGFVGGPFALVARCDHLHGQTTRGVIAAGAAAANLVIRVRKVAEVRGRLELRPAGVPCLEGEVILQSVVLGDLQADTDREGRVVFPAVPPGTYRVDVSCKGHVANEGAGQLVVGDADRDEVFAATERATIRGTVVDGAGEPLPGVMVFAARPKPAGTGDAHREDDEPTGPFERGSHDFSNEDGTFALHDLAPGPWALDFEAYPRTEELRVVVPETGSPEPIRIVLDRRVLVGRLLDRDGNSVWPAYVAVAPSRSERHQLTEVDESGRFRATYVGDPRFLVQVEVAGCEATIQGDARVGEPTPSERIFVVDVPSGELTGRVVGARGEPVADARVMVSCGDDRSAYVTTDELGEVRVRHLAPGSRCEVEVDAKDGQTAKQADLPVGTPFRMSLAPAAVLRGLADTGGKPFAVTLTNLSNNRFQRFSGETGAWEIVGVPAKSLVVQIETEGTDGRVEVVPTPGQTTVVTVPLAPTVD